MREELQLVSFLSSSKLIISHHKPYLNYKHNKYQNLKKNNYNFAYTENQIIAVGLITKIKFI